MHFCLQESVIRGEGFNGEVRHEYQTEDVWELNARQLLT